MNKKGFTLVELLVVIVILSVLIVIVTTVGLKSVGDTKNKIASQSIKALEDAGNQIIIDVENCEDDFGDSEIIGKVLGLSESAYRNCSTLRENVKKKTFLLNGRRLMQYNYLGGSESQNAKNLVQIKFDSNAKKDQVSSYSGDTYISKSTYTPNNKCITTTTTTATTTTATTTITFKANSNTSITLTKYTTGAKGNLIVTLNGTTVKTSLSNYKQGIKTNAENTLIFKYEKSSNTNGCDKDMVKISNLQIINAKDIKIEHGDEYYFEVS